MFCGNCGKKLEDNILKCPFCNWVATEMTDSENTNKQISPEKEILLISERVPELTLTQIVTNTNLEIDEAENAIKKLVNKGIAKETENEDGKKLYIFYNETYKLLKLAREEEKEDEKKEKKKKKNVKRFYLICLGIVIVYFLAMFIIITIG